ncbi:NAD(P)-dependent oxidoreductase [Oxalobacter formigenes]|nr:NAD(P)-dependent oxidoreductase [Oxalobacter formigenes]ARQ45324.1 2-hydroxy-3-oxopropionate reductase [Oxalobacter formigenes]ARQ77613.1 2-hydroxy-3-oxopropionate reductase [Oxalobacter formigenes OXCC13]MCZ4063730.1 NAD(P)-dependent oxidoreductase [Oxalobacter formigenes]QDX33846.1 NAD(P)-dependent oxidoreductase [Oxalobacter formigenes]WAW02007.1 NAD(P)-dependent oxidoreductase [Oxalobacter formigenes]
MLPRIAFVGIGLMGLPMASRLLRAGYPLSAWNRTKEKALPLTELGADVADSLKEAVASADIVITMLEAGPIVKRVVQDMLPSLKASALVIDMSSTRQSEAKEVAGLLASRQIAFLDAPVSGGVVGAEAGTLAIMVGGSEDDFKRAEPVFKVMGRPTLVGPNGAGQVAKLCNQLIVGGTVAIVAEAMLLAEAGGADPAAMRAAIRGGFAESRILEVHGQRMLDRNFKPGGQIKSQAKDHVNIMAAAEDAGLQLPLTALVADLFDGLLATHESADQAAALLALEELNKGIRLGEKPDQF